MSRDYCYPLRTGDLWNILSNLENARDDLDRLSEVFSFSITDELIAAVSLLDKIIIGIQSMPISGITGIKLMPRGIADDVTVEQYLERFGK